MKYITSTDAIYEMLFRFAMLSADQNQPVMYSSRIDGCLLPAYGSRIEVAPAYLSSITVRSSL